MSREMNKLWPKYTTKERILDWLHDNTPTKRQIVTSLPEMNRDWLKIRMQVPAWPRGPGTVIGWGPRAYQWVRFKVAAWIKMKPLPSSCFPPLFATEEKQSIQGTLSWKAMVTQEGKNKKTQKTNISKLLPALMSQFHKEFIDALCNQPTTTKNKHYNTDTAQNHRESKFSICLTCTTFPVQRKCPQNPNE